MSYVICHMKLLSNYCGEARFDRSINCSLDFFTLTPPPPPHPLKNIYILKMLEGWNWEMLYPILDMHSGDTPSMPIPFTSLAFSNSQSIPVSPIHVCCNTEETELNRKIKPLKLLTSRIYIFSILSFCFQILPQRRLSTNFIDNPIRIKFNHARSWKIIFFSTRQLNYIFVELTFLWNKQKFPKMLLLDFCTMGSLP